ncbi:hypothetical protein Gotur_011646 [Gossypium turneri]
MLVPSTMKDDYPKGCFLAMPFITLRFKSNMMVNPKPLITKSSSKILRKNRFLFGMKYHCTWEMMFLTVRVV